MHAGDFGCGHWNVEGDNISPLTWREYEKPLGAPKGPAKYDNGTWTRSFASGTEVMLDAKAKKGTLSG